METPKEWSEFADEMKQIFDTYLNSENKLKKSKQAEFASEVNELKTSVKAETLYRKVAVSEDELFHKVCEIFNNRPLIRNGECIEWAMHLNACGYGVLKVNGKLHRAHRYVYPIFHNVQLYNFHVLHKCDNPKCVNPHHLFLGTHKDNMQDKKNKNRAKTGKSSKYNYVSLRKDNNKWRVSRKENGKMVSYGQFETEDEAGVFVQKNLIQKHKQ